LVIGMTRSMLLIMQRRGGEQQLRGLKASVRPWMSGGRARWTPAGGGLAAMGIDASSGYGVFQHRQSLPGVTARRHILVRQTGVEALS